MFCRKRLDLHKRLSALWHWNIHFWIITLICVQTFQMKFMKVHLETSAVALLSVKLTGIRERHQSQAVQRHVTNHKLCNVNHINPTMQRQPRQSHNSFSSKLCDFDGRLRLCSHGPPSETPLTNLLYYKGSILVLHGILYKGVC